VLQDDLQPGATCAQEAGFPVTVLGYIGMNVDDDHARTRHSEREGV
jgi:hypothetical protein